MPILPSLRINPVATINSSNIFVLPQGYAFPAGPVTITEISLRRGSLFRLIPTPLGTDFYFPFIPNNVGSCVVNHPFNGQIVTTLALSGCAIEVHSFPSLNRYVFYHVVMVEICIASRLQIEGLKSVEFNPDPIGITMGFIRRQLQMFNSYLFIIIMPGM